jgi:hypothetical protein
LLLLFVDCPDNFLSSDVDGERPPALDLNAPAVDDLTGDDGAAAALGAYLDRDAPSDAVRSRSGPHGSDAGSTPVAEASAGHARGGTSALRRRRPVDLWEEGRAHPTWDHHGGVMPRRTSLVGSGPRNHPHRDRGASAEQARREPYARA